MTEAQSEPAISSHLAQALDWLEALGAAAGVRLILDSGTLLGLVREGRTLTNDAEIDVSTTAPDAVDRVLAVLGPARANVWRYAGHPYRIEVRPFAGGPPLPTEIKFFNRVGDDYVCPAIGWRSPGGTLKTRSTGVRNALRPAWRALIARGDAASFPMRHFARTDQWVVPAQYFDSLAPIGDRAHCCRPADVQAYLALRYGDWQTPAPNWVTWRDDGAYRPSNPAVRAAQLASPHRNKG